MVTVPRRFFFPFLLFGVFFFLSIQHQYVGAADTGPDTPQISLHAKNRELTAKQIEMGQLHFTADIRNTGSTILLLGHPLACFPEHYKIGDPFSPQKRYGKSELLLEIKKPSGKHMTIRQGGKRYFEPGNFEYLYLLPNSSKTVYIGWFGGSRSDRWENHPSAASVFNESGEYTITLFYKNTLPKIAIRTNPMKKPELTDGWKGELRSNPLLIKIK